MHLGSSSTQAGNGTYQESKFQEDSPAETRQLASVLGFKIERCGRLDQPPSPSLPSNGILQYNPSFSSVCCVDRDPGAEATADYTNRHQSPLRAYLSPGYSSVHSPSMASDGIREHSNEMNKAWMMTPTRDVEGNTPHRTSTPASLGGTGDAGQAFVSSYDPPLLGGIFEDWLPDRSNVHPTGRMGLYRSTEHVVSGVASMPTQHHQSVPVHFLLPAPPGDSSTNYQYASIHNFEDSPVPPVGVSPYEARGPLFASPIRLSAEAPAGTAVDPSGVRECLMPVVEDASPLTLPHNTSRKPLRCKSCKKTITDQMEEAAHDRECDGLLCMFYFAGCKARFKGKNELKRHIKTQHLLSIPYVCPDCEMKEFNRKDLFKQHYIRMHSTAEEIEASKRKRSSAAFEKKIEDKLRQAIPRESQMPPPKVRMCFMQGCQTKFGELDSWERCLEHVAKHHEAMTKGKEEARCYDFTDEQLGYFQKIGAIARRDGRWVLGAQSSGERARKNKKKIAKRKVDAGPAGSRGRSQRHRRT
ncbi:hypothetical protein ED733_008792 [Metarhizium rileyi]|nr:hypothetical protein ED733_008792 [Metarhizium rileyi]